MSKLTDHTDRLAMKAFGRTKAEAHTKGICIDCGASVFFDVHGMGPGNIYTSEGLKEYGISGLCEYCFDSRFSEGD